MSEPEKLTGRGPRGKAPQADTRSHCCSRRFADTAIRQRIGSLPRRAHRRDQMREHQIGDSGTISKPDGLQAEVTDTSKPLGRLHAHHTRIKSGSIAVGDTVHMEVDIERRDAIRANHSATHLLHAALRNRLGDHVAQKGSLVAEDRLRFDFAHPKPLSDEDVAAIEAEVNAEIRANDTVTTRLMSPDDAVEAGALALFGEKYGDEVRVLSMGRTGAGGRNYSVELCGGTHVRATGDIGIFRIVSEGAVSSGVRRVAARKAACSLPVSPSHRS